MIKYFYTITISWMRGSATNVGTVHGVADVPSGETQETVYKALFGGACERFGAPKDGSSVTHYYLARNEL